MKRSRILFLVVAIGCAVAALSPLGAATLVVTSTGDAGPGTLRNVLAGAGPNDIVVFAVSLPAQITLSSGEILVPSVTIAGPGAGNLTISGNNANRVFQIVSSSTAMISGVTITQGLASGGGVGANILNDNASLTLNACTISHGRVTGGSTGHGGGIYSSQGTLTLTNCLLDRNQATGNGGGVYSTQTATTISHCTIDGNSATNGGGVHNNAGAAMIRHCTVVGNAATNGAALANVGGPASLAVSNSTICSNSVAGAGSRGSAIYNFRASFTATTSISSCTIINNNPLPGTIPGVIHSNSGTVTIGNTILQPVAQDQTIVMTNGGVVTSAGYNLSADAGAGVLNASGDLINTNPLLDFGTGPRDNGGPTATVALQSNSPAIDRGRRDTIAALVSSADQRGEARPFDDPDLVNVGSSDGSDVGAYEAGLRMVTCQRSGNDLQVSFTTVVGRNYEIQSRSDLVAGDWGTLPGASPGTGGIVPRTISNALSQPKQFYRARQVPPAPSRPQSKPILTKRVRDSR